VLGSASLLACQSLKNKGPRTGPRTRDLGRT